MKEGPLRKNGSGVVAKRGWWLPLLLLLTLLTSAACSGGAALVAGGGIGGTGVISIGPILAFGSIWVNGVEYEINNAAITINGMVGSQADLTRGMIVRVEGTVNPDGTSGSAEFVTFSRDIAGPVSAVDQDNRTITVLGQTVVWDSETFGDDSEPGTWDPPAVGDYVEISGLPTQNGWLARAINHREESEDSDIAGVVSNLDTMHHTFTINGLEVHYQGMMGGLQNGDYIEVSGRMQDNVLIASHLEMRQPVLAGDDGEMEVEGIVHSYDAATRMLTMMAPDGRYEIDAAAALFEHGSEADLVMGARVEVSGYIQDAFFYAEEIEFKGRH